MHKAIDEKQYKQLMDILYNHLQLIHLPRLAASCADKWYNHTLGDWGLDS